MSNWKNMKNVHHGSRWCRKTLNSLPPMDALSLHLHTEQLSLKEAPNLAKQLLHIRWMRKSSCQHRKERLRHNLAINPTQAWWPTIERIQAYSWGVKGLNPTSGTTVYKSCIWAIPLKANKAYIHEAPKSTENQNKWFSMGSSRLTMANPSGTAQRQQAENHPVFLRQRSTLKASA